MRGKRSSGADPSSNSKNRAAGVVRSIEIAGPRLAKVGYQARKAAAERARERDARRGH